MSAWMSIIEYARQYNVSDMTVRRRIKTGRLNAELREGKYYIPVSESTSHKVEVQEPLQRKYENQPTQRYSHKPEIKEHRLRAVEALSSSQALEIQMDRLSENFECAIDQIREREELLKENFASERKVFQEKTNLLDHQMRSREKEIEHLKKEIEDLEILVRILEGK